MVASSTSTSSSSASTTIRTRASAGGSSSAGAGAAAAAGTAAAAEGGGRGERGFEGAAHRFGVKNNTGHRRSSTCTSALFAGRTTTHKAIVVVVVLLLFLLLGFTSFFDLLMPSSSGGGASSSSSSSLKKKSSKVSKGTTNTKTKGSDAAAALLECPYKSLEDLTDLERHPKATSVRHIVDPPKRPISDTTASTDADEPLEEQQQFSKQETDQEEENQLHRKSTVTLVCCHTTAGPWNIVVHEAWAPIGAQRFLDMVNAQHFDATAHSDDNANEQGAGSDAVVGGVPLMRCIHKFLCQFGLAGKRKSEQFRTALKDDPQWLPGGPTHRANVLGVKRFQKGYLSYAGGGPNTRDNQLFVALADNGPLGGGSPWEVPWGELVGPHSYETLDKIYTGYGEGGPSQHLLWQEHSLPVVRKEFPKLDWITSCQVVDEGTEE